MHYRIRADVSKLLGRGVVGSCFGVHFFVNIRTKKQLIDISSDSVMHKGIPIAIVRVRRKILLAQYVLVVLEN
jgi:hypothetical protein